MSPSLRKAYTAQCVALPLGNSPVSPAETASLQATSARVRREWLIVAGVLLPFAVLVAVGFLRQPTVSPTGAEAAPATLATPEPVEPPPAKPLAQPRDSTDAGLALPALEPAIEAPVRAVTSEVAACFADNGAHLHGRQEVRVAFRPTREGAFSEVTVESVIVAPQLRACLEDVFAEMRFTPTGRETFEAAKYTFIFDAPPQ